MIYLLKKSSKTKEKNKWDIRKTHEKFHFVECLESCVMRFRVWLPRDLNAFLYETVDPTFPDRNGTRKREKVWISFSYAEKKDKWGRGGGERNRVARLQTKSSAETYLSTWPFSATPKSIDCIITQKLVDITCSRATSPRIHNLHDIVQNFNNNNKK